MMKTGKIYTLALALAAASVLPAWAANSDMVMKAPFKQSDSVQMKTCQPVVKGTTVWYGDRKVEIMQDGSIICNQPDGQVFDLSQYYVETKNGKYADSFTPQRKKNNRFQMEEVKFDGKVFTQKGKYSWKGQDGEFLQTTEILPDGRLKVTNRLKLPPEQRPNVTEDGFFINFPSAITYGKAIFEEEPGGKQRIVKVSHRNMSSVASGWKDLPCRYTIGKGTGKEIIIEADLKYCGRYSIYNYDRRTALRLFARKTKDPNTSFTAVCIIDPRKVPAKSKKPDNMPDFTALENIRTFDIGQTRNLLSDPSFEQNPGGSARIIFPGFDFPKIKWECGVFSLDPAVKLDGDRSLRIKTFSKTRRGDWRGIYEGGDCTLLPVMLRPGKYVFSCYCKGDRKGQELSVWAGRTSLPVEKDRPAAQRGDRWMKLAWKAVPVTSEWTRMEFPMDVVIDQPMCISFNGISPTGDGSIWIDCIQLEKGEKATPWQGRIVESRLNTEKADNFLEYGKPHDLNLTVSAKTSGKASTRIVDFYDNVLWSKNYEFKPGKTNIKLDFNPDRGVFVVKTDYTFADGKKSWDAHRFSVMSFLDNKHKHKNLFSIDYQSFCRRSDFPQVLERCRQVGFGAKGWAHCYGKNVFDLFQKYGMEVSHGFITNRTGKYGQSFYEVFALSSPNARGTVGTPLIKDWREESGLDSDVSDEYLKRFKEAVKVRVKNYPWYRRWSFHGEDDAGSPKLAGMPASDKAFRNYVKLHLAALEAVKEVDPTLEMIGGQIPCNTSPTGVPAVERFLKVAAEIAPGKRYDCFAIHTYRNRPENPDLDIDITRLRKSMKTYGYDEKTKLLFPEGGQYNLYYIPAWRLEIAMWNSIHSWLYGAVSYEMGWTEKMVAGLHARHWLTLLKIPNTSFATIAALSGQVFDIDLALTPFATQKAVNTMGRLLGDASFVKDIRFAPTVRCYVFEDGQKRPVAAVWTHDPKIENGTEDAMVAAVPFNREKVEIYDLMEAERKPVFTTDGKLRLGISAHPIFLRGQPGRTAAFVQALEKARVIEGGNILPVDLKLTFTADKALLQVKNPSDTPIKDNLIFNKKTIPLQLKGNESTVLALPFARPITDRALTAQPVQLWLMDKFELDRSFEGILCRKVRGKPDWSRIPAVRFTKVRNRTNPKNLSGTWQIAWNSESFFIRVKITDDQFVHTEYELPHKRWNNDSLQIYFDTFCNARSKSAKGYDLDDYDYAVFPNQAGTAARVWRYYQPDIQLTLGTRTPPNYTFADDIPAGFTKTADGYVYEVAFPSQYLLPIQLKAGAFFGFGLYVNDRDGKPNADGFLSLAKDGGGCFNRPETWPVVILTE